MNVDELEQRLVKHLGEAAPPRRLLDETSREVHRALWAGEPVDLLGLLRLRVAPEALAGRILGRKAVEIEPLPPLLRRPAPKTAQRAGRKWVVLLAVEKEDRFSRLTARRLTNDEREAFVAEGLAGVMEMVKKHGVDVVIMDSDIEAGPEIREWLKSDPRRSLISLVVVYRQGENPEVAESLRIGEDEVLTEPVEFETLASTVDGEIARIEEERKYFLHEISFQFPSQGVYQNQAAELMEKLVSHSGLGDEDQMGLVVAFREAVDNAVRHGNKSRPDALISVAYVLDREKVTVTVADEGPGFDTNMYIETRVSGDAVAIARQRYKEGRQGGLGIMLMLKSLDRLEYNRDGNVVKLTKYVQKAAPAAS